MKSSLQRIEKYQNFFNYQLLPQLPIVVCAELRSFSRLSKNIPSEQESTWQDLFYNLLIQTASDIQFVIFGYFSGSNFIFVLRPDLFSSDYNNLQDLSSLFSSTLTAKMYSLLREPEYQIFTFPHSLTFKTFLFNLPSLAEVSNLLVSEQNLSFRKKISQFLRSHLESNLGKKEAFEAVKQKDFWERLEVLKELGFDFTSHRTILRGAATYKVPYFQQEELRKKWHLDLDLPLFSESKEFLYQILSKGYDLIRGTLE